MEAAFGSVPSEAISAFGAISADSPNSASNAPETIISTLSMFDPFASAVYSGRARKSSISASVFSGASTIGEWPGPSRTTTLAPGTRSRAWRFWRDKRILRAEDHEQSGA